MRDDLPRLLSPPTPAERAPNPAAPRQGDLPRSRAGLAAIGAGRANGVGLRERLRVSFPDALAFAPVRAKDGRPRRRRGRATCRVALEATADAEAAAPAGALPAGRCRPMASGGGYSGPLVYRQGEGMRPDVAAAFDRMAVAARAAGLALIVNSGFRSDAEQAALFAANPDPTLGRAPGPLAASLRDRARPRPRLRLRLARRQCRPLRVRPALLMGGLALRLRRGGPRPARRRATPVGAAAERRDRRRDGGLPASSPLGSGRR